MPDTSIHCTTRGCPERLVLRLPDKLSSLLTVEDKLTLIEKAGWTPVSTSQTFQGWRCTVCTSAYTLGRENPPPTIRVKGTHEVLQDSSRIPVVQAKKVTRTTVSEA